MSRDPHKWNPVCTPPSGLVRPVPIDPHGRAGPTRGQANGRKWRKTSRGLYVPAGVDGSVPEQRILEQSTRLTGGAVTGWGSCRMHGAAFFDGLMRDGRTEMPVPLCTSPLSQITHQAGSRISREKLFPPEITIVHGVVCTVRRRALFDAMRDAPDVREAVVAMDMMAAAELVSISQMREYTAAHAAWRGVQQVRDALELADEGSRSPNETRMRLIWELDAGLPHPDINQPVWTLNGRLLGLADIFDPVAGVVGEYDGADHRIAKRHSSDVAREENFRRQGLEYFKVTGPDMHNVPRIVDRMHSTRSRARWSTPADRRWTITPPPEWEVAPSLDGLFAYREVIHRPWFG
jgi:hypothetical protein